MKPGTLVKLSRNHRTVYDAVTVATPSNWYHIKPKQIGMFIRYEVHAVGAEATPGIFLFEEKLVSAYLEVFEPLDIK